MDFAHRLAQIVKWTVSHALRAAGVFRWLRRRRAARGEVSVLWLHRVDGTPEAPLPMAVPPEVFRRMLEHLQRDYVLSSWDACVRATHQPVTRPHVALTFDDGYLDNARVAWPIVKEAGGSAVFCVTTGFLSGSPLWWEIIAAARSPGVSSHPRNGAGEATYGLAEHEIEALKRVENGERLARVAAALSGLDGGHDRLPPAMSWEDARAMRDEGADFGGHTVSHPILPTCSEDEIEREVAGCRVALLERLGSGSGSVFAYPNGSYDARVMAAIRRSGFTHALTIEKGVFSASTDPWRVPRIGVSEPKYSIDGKRFSWTLFEAELLGVFDVLLMRRRRSSREAGGS